MRVINFLTNKIGKRIIRFFKARLQNPWQNFFLLIFILIVLFINAINTQMALLIGSDMKGYQFEIESLNSISIFVSFLMIFLLGCNSLLFANNFFILLNILMIIISLLIFDIYLAFIPDVKIIYRNYCNENVVLTRYKYHEIGFVGNRTNYDTFKQIRVIPGILKNTGEILEDCGNIKP